MLPIFKKKSLATLLASFVSLVADLRKLAEEKLAEAKRNEAKANTEINKLFQATEEAEIEAEEALAAADKIEELIGGSAVLEACVEKL